MRVFDAVFYLSLFSPLLLLTLTWHRLLSQQHGKYSLTITVLASLSYGYLLAALLFKPILLGADYSDRLFITVQANTGFTFVLFLIAVFRKSPSRSLLACSVFILSVAWFLLWVVNAAV